MKPVLIPSLTMAAAGAAFVVGATGPAANDAITFLGEVVTPETLLAGEEVYLENCATCHGADLQGQPDWQRRLENGRMPAPPHEASGHTWHHSDQSLFLITSEGLGAVVPGYESDMPAFGATLTETEIKAVLSYIKSTWPARERGFQDDVTRSETLGDNN